MSLLQVIVLSVVQGITEFLPVSSSGHLALIPWIAGWPDQGTAFDVALHLGTMSAVLIYFRSEWAGFLVGLLKGRGVAFGGGGDGEISARRLLLLVVIGTAPAAVIGLLTKGFIESTAREPQWIGVFLIGTAAALAIGELAGKRKRGLSETSKLDAVIIGLGQAAAILPGLSRSGTTIATGMAIGMTREAAARFSFLLVVPVILGAAVLVLGDAVLGNGGPPQGFANPPWGVMVLGGAIAFATALVALWGLMKMLRRYPLWIFAAYAFLLGSGIIIARTLGA